MDPVTAIVVAAIGGVLLTVRVWIREDHRTQRTQIISKNTKSEHRAAAIEAANRPWWRRPR